MAFARRVARNYAWGMFAALGFAIMAASWAAALLYRQPQLLWAFVLYGSAFLLVTAVIRRRNRAGRHAWR
jgi:hypothetical protein